MSAKKALENDGNEHSQTGNSNYDPAKEKEIFVAFKNQKFFYEKNPMLARFPESWEQQQTTSSRLQLAHLHPS